MRLTMSLHRINGIAASVIAVLLGINSAALAGQRNSGMAGGRLMSGPLLHGISMNHQPTAGQPLHGPGTSHNPIVKTSGTVSGGRQRRCIARGTVVHDH
jgi:hypothetical protein